MLSLFRIEREAGERVYTMVPRLEQVRRGLQQNMLAYRNFYHSLAKHAYLENVLVKLVTTLGISEHQSPEAAYTAIARKTTTLARVHGLTSSVSRGSIFNNHFFTNSREIVIAHVGLNGGRANWADWKTMTPLRILRHPFGDLWGNVPDGRPDAKGELSIFSIDIPMLAAMYCNFLKEQAQYRLAGHTVKGVAQFVYGHVLANTFEDMIDLAVLNRMNYLVTGEPAIISPRLHSVSRPDWSADVDVTLQYQIDGLVRLRRSLPTTLKQVQLIFSADLLEFSTLPDIAPTIQCYWALTISRIKMLAMTLRIMYGMAKFPDTTNVNRIQWSINLHRTPNVVRNNLPIDAYVQVFPDLNYVNNL